MRRMQRRLVVRTLLVLGEVLLLRKLGSTVLEPPSTLTRGAGFLCAAAMRCRLLTVSLKTLRNLTHVLRYTPVSSLAGADAAFGDGSLDVDERRVHGQVVPDRVLPSASTREGELTRKVWPSMRK